MTAESVENEALKTKRKALGKNIDCYPPKVSRNQCISLKQSTDKFMTPREEYICTRKAIGYIPGERWGWGVETRHGRRRILQATLLRSHSWPVNPLLK